MPDIADRENLDNTTFDTLIGAEVMLPNEMGDGHIR